MSAKRMTRSASRQASSRGASPALSDLTATPRRATRTSGGTPLPAINLRASTAYGTNTVPAFSVRGSQNVQQELGSALNDILKPVPEEEEEASTVISQGRGGRRRAPAQRTATPSVEANLTYGEESNVFKGAGFDTSSIVSQDDVRRAAPNAFSGRGAPNNLPTIEDYDELALVGENNDRIRAEDHDELALDEDDQRTNDSSVPPMGFSYHASNKPARKLEPKTKPPMTKTNIGLVKKTLPNPRMVSMRLVGSWISNKLQSAWVWALLFTCITLLMSSISRGSTYTPIVSSEYSYMWYGWDLRYNIGQFMPDWVVHPMEALRPSDLEGVQSDLRRLDFKVKSMRFLRNLDADTLERIEKWLPDVLVVKKDEHGVLQIPHDFWLAIRDLIRTDEALIPSPAESTKQVSASGYSGAEINAGWDKFLKANRAKITAWHNSELEEKFPRLLRDNILAPKSEILNMIRQNWNENQDGVKTELEKLAKHVETLTRRTDKLATQLHNSNTQIDKLHSEAVGRNREQMQAMIAAYIRTILPVAQLQALAKANLNNFGLDHTKLNHWSHGTGAVIDPHVTSENYIFPSMNKGAFEKVVRRYMMGNPVPVANPPEAALTRWDEHGDCWCTPMRANGLGPTLGVIMGSSIYPEEIVVEHIPPTASLEPASAPRDMELLAYMADVDYDTYNAVLDISRKLFPDSPDPVPHGHPHYIRIATWKYDLNSPENIQTFPVQLDLKQLLAHTSKLVVRVHNNWGGDKVDYTCLYRIRVHGEIAVKPSA